ncbi:Rhs-family protein [Salmonella enterica subsp. enterica serovar Johannesburg str. S5-703]|nr:Rhs-family protein [Salmonella enterica subsp. enterica serovar Johannesburg str. S5-703]
MYDAPGRRVEKHELDAEGKPYNRTTFLWDGMRLAQECRLGRSSSLYIYSDQGSHEPLARVDRAAPGEADEVLYYHTDVNGALLSKRDRICLYRATLFRSGAG